jgi:hypothetical protein
MSYNEATDSPAKRRASQRLDGYIARGKMDGVRLRKTVQETIIRPLKVFTKDMRFQVDQDLKEKIPLRYFVTIDGVEEELTLHVHAFGRMRQEVDLSHATTRVMLNGPDWDQKNLEMLLNTKFAHKAWNQRGGGLPRFINLVVGSQVRGFVGRGFKRHLRSGPLLDAFIQACARYNAMPVEAFSTDLRITLRCMLPHIFCPRDDEFLGLGVSLSNSDFGAGTYRIDMNVMSLRNGQVMPMKTLNGSGKGEGHQGGGGDDSVTDSTELSEDTVQKLIRAKQGEVNDLVTAALRYDKVNEFFDQVADAMGQQISWYKFERFLRGKLTQEEMEAIQGMLRKSAKSAELPTVKYDADDQAIMDLWFASNVLGQIAEKCNDPEKKESLQDAAGKLLAG